MENQRSAVGVQVQEIQSLLVQLCRLEAQLDQIIHRQKLTVFSYSLLTSYDILSVHVEYVLMASEA